MRAIDYWSDGLTGDGPRVGRGVGGLLAPLIVFLVALALFSIHLGQLTGEFDEYYHILAARGWLATGEPRILDGLYERTELFTILVAEMFRLFGDSFWAARLPAMVASAVLATALFLWLRARAGTAVAWTGTCLFAISPFTIEIAQLARFYALQSLAFFLGVIAVEAAAAPDRTRGARIGLGLGALAALAAALYLQVTTMIGLVGLALWLACVRLLPWLLAQPPRRRAAAFAGVVSLGILGLVFLLATTRGHEIIALYRFAPTWGASQQNQIWFYHLQLALHYPALWPFIPFLALWALAVRPRAAFLAFAIFGVAFVVHSFAALKSMSYIAYAMPFFWTLVAIGLVALAPTGRTLVGQLGIGLARLVGLPGRARLLGLVALVASLAFLLVANPAFVRSVAMLNGIRLPPQTSLANWPAAAERLAPLTRSVDVVVDSERLETLYYLGRHDLLIGSSRLSEMPIFGLAEKQFAVDPRVGRPVISISDALARVIDCYHSGLVLSGDERWRNPAYLNGAVADLLVRRATAIDLPASWSLHAWHWENPQAPADPAAAGCPPIGHAAALAAAGGKVPGGGRPPPGTAQP